VKTTLREEGKSQGEFSKEEHFVGRSTAKILKDDIRRATVNFQGEGEFSGRQLHVWSIHRNLFAIKKKGCILKYPLCI